ncbi:uncharacterized protein LOC132036877 [Lycium ferocissimum]|uniref:uncharacterized protein LOC132036877 n=1 Tax=Lycium ferocissimum TaxID=112874 RepID=UPI002814B853|nr:uncharacterized protein LOC132036877 [Lycium ferocissimum]
MSGRTLFLILFFWAVLTIVTPILVRLSASAKANGEFFVITHTSELIKERLILGLVARKALVVAAPRKKDSTATLTPEIAKKDSTATLTPEIAISPPSLKNSTPALKSRF